MGIFDRFPYSSTHEMNLDYMLGKATEIAEDMQTLTAGMEQVQAGLSAISEKTEQATQAAAQAAQSASSIEGSVTAAEEAAEEAQMHNESAQTWANNALTYKADCQRAATEAAASSSSAAQAATAAAASEDTVATYAQAANASAQSAANNNDSAHQYANQASASASNATFHSSNAQTAATNAQTAATNANTSATNAAASADRAATLKTDVETLHRMCAAAVDQAATDAVNAANSAAQAAATKTDVETLVESLPEDFTDLNNTVNQLSDEIADVNVKLDMNVSRNIIGPDLDTLYPIPHLKTGDVVTASAFNPASVNTWTQIRLHAADGTRITYFQFDTSNAETGRKITLDLGEETAYYISVWHDCGSPIMVECGNKTDFIPHYTTNYEKYLNSRSNFGEFELFLPEQAEIVRNNLATARMAKRLCFGHVSDNHSTADKFISDIVDMSDAKFIANTGDIVQDKFQDAYTTFPAMINAMTKPYYITLGNHDVYKAPSVSDIFNKYFAPIIDHNGQTGLNKTYYSVDFTDEGIKCIFLDLYDAIADYSVSMETVIAGKMSATQINWFLGQLDAALASHMHVCVFLHLSPEMVGEKELKFFDVNTTESRKVTYTFIPDVIDAFLDGGSVTFNYDGNSYTHTFASSGVFVGYFCGHMHCDCIGKLKTHNRQNAFSVTRPWQSSTTNTIADGTYRHGSSKWGSSTFNYVTVDPTTRHVSVMRVLQQETKYGFKRDFVTMEY